MYSWQENLFDEIFVDNFAGGGGASVGIELATGKPITIAINHDPDAIAMHEVNHPCTHHYQESVWNINPIEVTGGRPVGIAWFSPDCKHFSKAKGGKPVDKRIRGLAWIALRWAGTVRPRIIMLENVEEFLTWGPVRRGKPVKSKQGQTFRKFVGQLRELGYAVEWRILRACDYGAPTIRKRFYLIARCDNLPIVFPEPTHGEGKLPYKTAADCIDWSLPCSSIFARKKPLAENTYRRIARGIDKFVINNPKPFIVQFNFDNVPQDVDKPLTTATTVGHHYLVSPTIVQYHTEQSDKEVRGQRLTEPLQTIDASPRYGVSAVYLTKHYSGEKQQGAAADSPLPTVTAVDHNALTAANLVRYYGGADLASNPDEPLATIRTKACHYLVESNLLVFERNVDCKVWREPMPTILQMPKFAEIRTYLVKSTETSELSHWDEVRKLLNKYCGYNIAPDEMLIISLAGTEYFIADIGMRMLKPRELARAQGVPEDYCLDIESKIGKKYSETKQIARIGNMVCPPVAEALVRANYTDTATRQLRTMAQLFDYMTHRSQRAHGRQS